VQAAVVGSVLANVLLVLGLAFVAGGVRHGTQRFDGRRARDIVLLLVLAVAALALPTLTHRLHTPAAGHEHALSVITSIALLLVFALSVPGSLRRGEGDPGVEDLGEQRWPLAVALGLLAASGVLAALVSDWFVHALTPAIDTLNISQTFAGLVVTVLVTKFVVYDGESTWLEGSMLLGLYVVISAAFWWG
jgi:Ca2+:H+ antiporter